MNAKLVQSNEGIIDGEHKHCRALYVAENKFQEASDAKGGYTCQRTKFMQQVHDSKLRVADLKAVIKSLEQPNQDLELSVQELR